MKILLAIFYRISLTIVDLTRITMFSFFLLTRGVGRVAFPSGFNERRADSLAIKEFFRSNNVYFFCSAEMNEIRNEFAKAYAKTNK